MAKKKPTDTTSASELEAANAAGETPQQYEAEFSTPPARAAAAGETANTTPDPGSKSGPNLLAADTKEIASLKKQLKTAQAGEKTTQAKDAYTQLADAQANQFLQTTKNLDPLTSGATLPAIEGTASSAAEQMLGQSATSPVSQWLNQQTQAAQAQNAPLEAAEQGVASAQDSANKLTAQGLQSMGTAETQMMNAAPYTQLLQSLAADVPYKLANNYSLSDLINTAKTAESAIGLNTGSTPTAADLQASTNNPLLPFPTQTVAGPAPSTATSQTGNNPVIGP